MSESFNIEQFRQQMKGEDPAAPQPAPAPAPAQMQQVPAAPQPMPAQVQAAPAIMQPQPQQQFHTPQMVPAQMMPQQASHQQIQPPMPPQPQPVPQPQFQGQPQQPQQQPQPQPQPYIQPVAGQLQAWAPQGQAPQGQAVPMVQQAAQVVPQMAAQMMPQQVFTAPAAALQAPLEEARSKKPRFNLKRLKKEKMPKVKKAEVQDMVEGQTLKTSPAIIFMFGLVCGILIPRIVGMIL